jgi:hypothetical protein
MALSLAAAACGAPGYPDARHPVTPTRVTDLAAVQAGDGVLLRFTLPANSTNDKALPAPPDVEVYRATLPPGALVPAKLDSRLLHTIPGSAAKDYTQFGRIEFLDPLDPAETAATPGKQMAYLVRARASRKGVSADSNVVVLHIYPAPAPVADLRAMLTEQAVNLSWTAPTATGSGALLPGPLIYRVYRAELQPQAESRQPPARPQLLSPPMLLSEAPDTQYADSTFQFDHTYLYSVRAVEHFGSDAVESSDRVPITSSAVVAAKDIFPPAVPQNLVAVFVPGATGAPAFTEVTWAINTEPDLAGYAVFRSDTADSSGKRFNTDLLPEPAFRDMSVVPGRRYYYRVQAVDRDGNQSALSDPVAVEIP